MFMKPSILTEENTEIISFHLLLRKTLFINVEIGLLEVFGGNIMLSECLFDAWYYEKKLKESI